MQVYFVKATYTNNVYKLSDFFLNGTYRLDPNKMLDINFIANDDATFINGTRKLLLPDGSSIREYTHIIVPSYEKIYRITSINYLNAQQVDLFLKEDALIGNYFTLEDTDIILQRTNDKNFFRGINDVSDVTLKETVEIQTVNSNWKTGKWALLFYKYDPAAGPTTNAGLNFVTSGIFQDYQFASLAALIAELPEVETTSPELFEYYQKVASVAGTPYQCVYDESTGVERLLWIEELAPLSAKVYVGTQNYGSKINGSDVISFTIAIPFETDLFSPFSGNRLLDYSNFVGPIGTDLIDIKIVDDLVFNQGNISYSLAGRVMQKTINFDTENVGGTFRPLYTDAGLTTLEGRDVAVIVNLENDIDLNPSYFVSNPSPKDAEPFNKYDLYVYGNKFSIPYYLTNKIRLLIAYNSGVINYLIYYENKRNIIGSGSFTHSVRYSIDQLEAFYRENPTYKDQFYLKQGANAFKTVSGGLSGGLRGVGSAAISAGIDAGLADINLKMMEKGLALKPDQIFGENSEISLQLVNVFAIYWVKRISENADLMDTEFELRGFPTEIRTTIDNMDYSASTLFPTFGLSKIVYGQIKEVVRNEYATNFINEKLKEGIILIP